MEQPEERQAAAEEDTLSTAPEVPEEEGQTVEVQEVMDAEAS